ncbi:unnamed protein product [Ixodes persulcatus]
MESLSSVVFKQQFRFDKGDFDDLARGLLMPEFVTSSQDVVVPGREALCLTLRRLAYPNKWCDLEPIFGRHASVMSSVTSKVLQHISKTFGHLLTNCNNHEWLTPARMVEFASASWLPAVHNKGGPLPNCWGFIDGTARPICRPKRNQKAYFSGHKRMHVVKYQSIMCPNGIVCQLDGPYPGRRHDAGILRDSGLYSKLERLVGNQDLVIYGDPAYPLKPLLLKPYGGSSLTPTQQAFNFGMSRVRQAVEWGCGKVVAEFAFLDFKKNQKLLRQQVEQMYKVGTILCNCHTAIYGSQVTSYFNLDPPSLQEYLRPVAA